MTESFTYDDIAIGYSFAGPTINVTREMISEFAQASCDNNPLHWDDDFMADTTFANGKQFKSIIGHGLMSYSFMLRAMTDWLYPDNGNHRRMETRFRSPVYPGDTLEIRVEVRDKRITRKGKWLDCLVTVTNQNQDVVSTGDALAEILH